jgi:hypothetical protein
MTSFTGDAQYLSSYLINTKVYGVVVPPGENPEFWATYEIAGDNGTLFMAAILGPDGVPGKDAFALTLQTDQIASPDQLPSASVLTDTDIGKYWLIDDVNEQGDIIGTSMYVWYGGSWRRLMLGSPGPPGPTPIITPSVELVNPDTASSEIVVGGSERYPTWHMKLAVPQGPRGPAPTLDTCPDIDFVTNPPQPGDVLGFTGRYANGKPVWVPVSISQLLPSPYSMPQSAFSAYSGFGTQKNIGSFVIPPQPFPWTPIVWGHCVVDGAELSATPFTIGCEVRLGNFENGPTIARGFGNSFADVNIMPHYSTPGAYSGTALSPYNSHAVVQANHTVPADGTIYVNLYNDGNNGQPLLAAYNFNPANAQIFVLVMPVGVSSPLLSA